MRFLLDCDGVASDLIGTILCEIARVRPYEKVPTPDDIVTDDFRVYLNPWQKDVAEVLMSGSALWRNLAVLPGAQEGVEKIKIAGHEIFWVTSPWLDCPTWEHERRNWLIQHFGATPDNIVFCKCKHVVEGDVLIDDRPKNVTSWRAAHPDKAGILYSQPWSRNSGIKLFTWDMIDVLLETLKGA